MMTTQIENGQSISRSGYSKEFSRNFSNTPSRQTGAILLIAMVVLVAMTLSALALIKSVNTTNLIAGNLGFRESALLASDHSMEQALLYLDEECTGDCLRKDHGDDGKKCYWATRVDPDPEVSDRKNWEVLMNKLSPCKLDDDEAGNTVSYVIQRLCRNKDETGKTDEEKWTNAQCSYGTSPCTGCSNSEGFAEPDRNIFYRITTRVKGPRNTAVYTQTIITK
jgi:Tfp pilus assembly protein PilX